MRAIKVLLRGATLIVFGFIHDVIQAIALGFAPADHVFLESLKPGRDIYRNNVLHDLANELRAKDLSNELMQQAAKFVGVRDHTASNKKRVPIGFELNGEAGRVLNIVSAPQCLFHGNKIIAIDDSGIEGSTLIGALFIGNQSGFVNPIPIEDFSREQCNNDLVLAACLPGVQITFQVIFNRACTLHGVMFGYMVS